MEKKVVKLPFFISTVVIALLCVFMCFTLSGSEAAYAETSENSVILPIIMYHGILNSVKGKYLVSERQLDSDLSALERAGYNYVFPSEVIEYIEKGSPLPKNPIMITFDDGFYNIYYYGKNLIEKHNAKALISTVGSFTERTIHQDYKQSPHYSYVTWTQICELGANKNFEIGNHTFDMHKKYPRFGIGRMDGESADSYASALTADALKMKNKLNTLEIQSEVFTYPFGKYSDDARDTLKNLGYKMFLTCNEGVNRISVGNSKSIECMYRINRDGAYSTDNLLRIINTYKSSLK